MDRQPVDRMTSLRSRRHGDGAAGFSLIEVIIACGLLTTGVLALAGVLVIGLRQVAGSSPSLIAREKAREAVESVHTARDTGELSWGTVRNTTSGGVFVTGAQPLKTAGADGLVNTADDGAIEQLRAPGRDGVLGTGDDVLTPLTNYTREIQITDLMRDGTTIVNPNLRQIVVIVRYQVSGSWQTYRLTTFVSSFS
jgi:hypothetical protein